MKTECPHCHTIFAITQQQLELAEGMVRCGVCAEVFNALVQDDLFVSDKTEAPAVSDAVNVATSDDSEPNDRLTQPDAAPGVHAADDAEAHRASTAEDTTAGEHAHSPATTEPPRDDDHIVLEAEDSHAQQHDELFADHSDFVVPDDIRYQQHSADPLSTALWSLGSIVTALILVLQLAWLQRDSLMQVTALSPWVDRLCQYVDCSALGLRAPDRIEMTARNIYTHPTEDDALMISVTLVNRASFAQDYPDIGIHFSDRIGTVIASRQFRPGEYLGLDPQHIRPLQPEQPVSFGIGIADPGDIALTYEFEFL